MRFKALGGAQEIGASCYLVEIGSKTILLDCGLRPSWESFINSLPALEQIDRLDLILISHAHIDHSAALPVISKKFPKTKIICTYATFLLMMPLLMDSINLMVNYIMSGQKMLYEPEDIGRMLPQIFACPFRHWFKPFPDCKIQVCFMPAGHILGAAAILIDSPEGKLFYTGDFYSPNQRTIKGFWLPNFQSDLVITECTYGNRVHENRLKEESELAQAVARVIREKGKVIIPTFALGRGQELILILKSFQEAGVIPLCPIYVDGMVKNICRLYNDLLENKVFFSNNILAVDSDSQRLGLVKGDPCIIISSSGMLVGGPSVYYTQELTREEKNAIFLTSYQDEETPGGRLLKLQRGEKITLDQKEFTVSSQVKRYDLSAHADAEQINALLSTIKPKFTILVHGSTQATRNLKGSLAKTYRGRIFTPNNLETIEIFGN